MTTNCMSASSSSYRHRHEAEHLAPKIGIGIHQGDEVLEAVIGLHRGSFLTKLLMSGNISCRLLEAVVYCSSPVRFRVTSAGDGEDAVRFCGMEWVRWLEVQLYRSRCCRDCPDGGGFFCLSS